MEQRFSLHLTLNENKFIETAPLSELRLDGHCPFDYRKLTIKFGRKLNFFTLVHSTLFKSGHIFFRLLMLLNVLEGWCREDGSSEVQLGQTRVMAFVTSQLVQPYRDRPNEGTLSIYTEFSPMADPSYELGRPGEFATELGPIIDRGLRESRAVDTESLGVLSGKLVWAIRIDIHILDNGGNLVDAANIAALAALLTFRRPECTLGGEDGQQVDVHPPEVREPLPLTIHHLPIAVTFGFFSNENIMVIDPTHHEESVMTGRMTATLNANGDVCAVQKAGGEGIFQRVIMHCLQLAHVKAGDITSKIKNAVDSYNTERTLRKIKRHPLMPKMDQYAEGVNFDDLRAPLALRGISFSL
ncbi:hypothetical protein QN277_022078 [Acacia crassicarpa]|uniref:Protein ECERIFERUM 7 n=1 Tax=Acacia crassicarpa TaxID=499986 RepID=A0AAE1JH17_9FABA|nr:hypothetical protein QN277_022078 [Acacia crassicarpa]